MAVKAVAVNRTNETLVLAAAKLLPSGPRPMRSNMFPLEVKEPASVVEELLNTPSKYTCRSVDEILTKSIRCQTPSSFTPPGSVSTAAVAPVSEQFKLPSACINTQNRRELPLFPNPANHSVPLPEPDALNQRLMEYDPVPTASQSASLALDR